MERSTLSRGLRRLGAERWIQTLYEDKDQRLRAIELTAKGRAVAMAALPAWRKAQASVQPLLDRHGVRIFGSAGRK